MRLSRRKLFLAVPAVLVILAVTLLVSGLRVERSSSGFPGFITFSSSERQAERIEAVVSYITGRFSLHAKVA